MKTVIRKMPYEISQFHETEQWLSERAAEGLHFKECMLGYAKLIPGEKKNVRYRLEFAHDFREPSNEQKTLYAEMGWEYVTTIRGDYFLFRSEDENAPELHTEEAPIEKERKRVFWRQLRPVLILHTILFLFPSLLDVIRLPFEYGLAYTALQYSSWALLLFALAAVLLPIGIIRDIRLSIQYRKGKMDKKVLLPFSPTWVGLILLLAGSLIASMFLHTYGGADNAPEELSYPTLAQIDFAAYEELKGFIALRNDPERLGAYWESGQDFDCQNSYRVHNDPLVREEELWQSYATHPHESGVSFVDTVRYRVQSYHCLTSGLAERLLETELTLNYDINDWERVLHDGEADIYTLTDEWGYLHLILHRGRSIMYIHYKGEQDIMNFLPQYEAAITE